MKRVRVKYLTENGDDAKGLSPRRMTLTICTQVSGEKGEKDRERMRERLKRMSRKQRWEEGKKTIVGVAKRQIREACIMLGETGSKMWYSTFTYSADESRGRIALGDLESLRDKCNRFVGVMELSKEGDLHLHCLSDKDISSEWNKGYVHSRERYYNAEKAGAYLSKQYGNGVEYEVEYRGGTKKVKGMEGFRELWPRMPHVIVDKETKSKVGSYDYRVIERQKGKHAGIQDSVISKDEVKVGKGELFTVIKADLQCVGYKALKDMSVKEFRQRLNSLHVSRGINGTLYAHNNAKEPSALVVWMIKHKKQVLIDTFNRARDSLLCDAKFVES